ncbi:MAG: hypothetical protein F6K11_27690 [Leptolyngbya sp. SIO3F4]|nr:hypothetical protein [Leptolyngbya sp. SIO3F4]
MELTHFELPNAVQTRLQYLLDQQDEGHLLSLEEQEEAYGLIGLAEFLSFVHLRSTRRMQQA